MLTLTVRKASVQMKVYRNVILTIGLIMVAYAAFNRGVGDVIMTAVFWWLVYIVPWLVWRFYRWVTNVGIK